MGVDNMSNEELVQLIQQGIDAADNIEQLYMQNKGLIYAVVKKYRYACQSDNNSTPIIEMDELMHEAYFGLVKAVESYDASQGMLFMTYAPSWIRQAVKRYLENCGSVIRVPVHTQARVYQYNRATSYYLQNFNRLPSVQEYANWLHVSNKTVEQLQRFMFQTKVKSLDTVLPDTDNDEITLGDSVTSDIDIEGDITEKVSKEQLQNELWDLVSSVVQNDKMVSTLRYRYIDKLTLQETGERLDITKEMVRQYEFKALRRLRSNSRSKRLIEYLSA
jgi:RNA polymerase primary sigma factor